MKAGDRSRCLRCGGKIVLIHHPRIIALDVGMWVHVSLVRRFVANHAAVGPND